MFSYVNWDAVLRHPFGREKRREFRRNPRQFARKTRWASTGLEPSLRGSSGLGPKIAQGDAWRYVIIDEYKLKGCRRLRMISELAAALKRPFSRSMAPAFIGGKQAEKEN
jgi:hypothetical protein